MAGRRLAKELQELKAQDSKFFKDIKVDEMNLFKWQVLLLPERSPYNKGAFWIDLNFPADYPFKPPTVAFRTKIYHPAVDETGKFCLPIVKDEWKPAKKVEQIIQAVLDVINEPELNDPLRPNLMEECMKDKKKFLENAEEFTEKYAEKRPE